MVTYKLKYSGEKIDELLTKIDELTIDTATDKISGIVKLSNAVQSTSGVDGGIAATPAAVKAVYDALSDTKEDVEQISQKQVDADKKLTYYIGYDSQGMITLFKESET